MNIVRIFTDVPLSHQVAHREKKTKNRTTKRGTTTTMGFSCFRAIDKAYRDRSKYELVERRANTVKHLKQMEDLSLEQVNYLCFIYLITYRYS